MSAFQNIINYHLFFKINTIYKAADAILFQLFIID